MIRITIETDDSGRTTAQLQGMGVATHVAGAAPGAISGGEPPPHLHGLIAAQTGTGAPQAGPEGVGFPPAGAMQAIDAGAAPAWLHSAIKEATIRAAEEIIRRGEGI